MIHRPFSRFNRWLGVMLSLFLVITAIFSTTIDPWRINSSPWAISALDPAREISNTVRVGKAALANRGNWQAIILGSSRVEIGLNPAHPAFVGMRTVNLAMSAANLNESVPAGHYALDRNPDVRLLLLGIEAGDLHNDFDSRKYTHFYQSPFADNNRSIERAINQVIGGRALADSIATLSRYRRGIAPRRNALGQWLQPNHPPDIRRYAETTFQMGFENSADQWGYRPQQLRQAKAQLLADFIARVRRAGIEMHIFIPPQHALKQIHPTENRPQAIAWEHDLLALAGICREANRVAAKGPPVRLWSFLTFNELTTRPMPQPGGESLQMPGWFDLGHGQPVLGDRVIETLMGGEASPLDAVDLLGDHYPAQRAEWIARHERYCLANPDDVKWWRELVAQYWNPDKAPRPMANAADEGR